MRLALIADTFPPLRTLGAVQIRDLARELVDCGHEVTVMLPCANLSQPWQIESVEGIQVIRLRAPKVKDINYLKRTLAEFLMPFFMTYHLCRSPLNQEKWDGIIWYSPSIFHGPLVRFLKRRSQCKGYLIVRDIFPEWALDMDLMRRGPSYWFFKMISTLQYRVADIIGVQTLGNQRYFKRWASKPTRQLEVLPHWLDEPIKKTASVRLEQSPLAGRKIFVYAGNMGVAHYVDVLLDLAERFLSRCDIGFLFVGRGSEVPRLRAVVQTKKLTNVVFLNEIHPDEIADLYAQCHVGMLSLDPRHQSHNIPGKFVTYMQSGLPVLACINAGNDLGKLIREELVGKVAEFHQPELLALLATQLLEQIELDQELPQRCKNLFMRQFSVKHAAKQIVNGLSA